MVSLSGLFRRLAVRESLLPSAKMENGKSVFVTDLLSLPYAAREESLLAENILHELLYVTGVIVRMLSAIQKVEPKSNAAG